MVFHAVHNRVLHRLETRQLQNTLYVGQRNYFFPRATTFRLPSSAFWAMGELPFVNRSIEFVYGQMHESIPSPLILHRELLRTCRTGILTTRSPIGVACLDLPDEDTPQFVVWTESDTNRLCFLPAMEHHRAQLDASRFQRWRELAQFNPLFFFNLYQWEHPLELNIKLFAPDYVARMTQAEFHDRLEEACVESTRHTKAWLESQNDADGQSP